MVAVNEAEGKENETFQEIEKRGCHGKSRLEAEGRETEKWLGL